MAKSHASMSLDCLADNQEYPRLQAFVEQACARAGCSARQRLRVMLLVEELFTNTVRHGRRGTARVPVKVTIGIRTGKEIRVRYEDGAPRYDPFHQSRVKVDLSDSLVLRPLGGLGVLLIRELGRDVRYAWYRGRNRVTFAIPTEPSPDDGRK